MICWHFFTIIAKIVIFSFNDIQFNIITVTLALTLVAVSQFAIVAYASDKLVIDISLVSDNQLASA